MQARIEKMLHDRMRLINALRGLQHNYTEPCWCQMAVGNPMVHDHSPQCKKARKALELAEEECQSNE